MIALHTYHNVHLHHCGCSEGQRREDHPSGHFPQRPEGQTVHSFTHLSILSAQREFTVVQVKLYHNKMILTDLLPDKSLNHHF